MADQDKDLVQPNALMKVELETYTEWFDLKRSTALIATLYKVNYGEADKKEKTDIATNTTASFFPVRIVLSGGETSASPFSTTVTSSGVVVE